jgi:hypothetical protein
LRDECLNRNVFTTLAEAKVLIEQWRTEYNQILPHSACGYQPPAPEEILALQLGGAQRNPTAMPMALTQTVAQQLGAGQEVSRFTSAGNILAAGMIFQGIFEQCRQSDMGWN